MGGGGGSGGFSIAAGLGPAVSVAGSGDGGGSGGEVRATNTNNITTLQYGSMGLFAQSVGGGGGDGGFSYAVGTTAAVSVGGGGGKGGDGKLVDVENTANLIKTYGGLSHGDWTVNCQISGTTKVCSLSHQQFNKQNNQRLLAIELSSKTGDDATGTLALPFGLALAKGVNLTIDDQKLDGSLPFNTCQVVGCLVPVAFDGNVTPLLKAGTTLKIDAFAADTGQAVSFSIPLNGFSGALARTAELLAN